MGSDNLVSPVVPQPFAPAGVLSAPRAVAIEEIYRLHRRSVARWAARLGGPGVEVEDIVQDVFLVAGRRLHLFKGQGEIKTWLFRTTAKIVQAARRKQRLRRALAIWSDPDPPGIGAAQPTPEQAFQSSREVAKTYRILDLLPERSRRVIVLFEMEELTTAEIAELLQTKVATVRVWLFRARAQFVKEHARLYGDAGEVGK